MLKSFFILFGFLLVGQSQLISQTFKIYGGDTINKADVNGLKNGHWIVFGNMVDEPGYKPNQIVEEGKYVRNRKTGIWTSYFPNGNEHAIITYRNGRPSGQYSTFFENGQLEETGTWTRNRNTGDFKRFYENGIRHQEFLFNKIGKRDGLQKYYYDNGQLMIEGVIKDGKEVGEFKEYYSDGSLKAVKFFDEAGVINPSKTKTYQPKTPAAKTSTKIEVIDPTKVAKVVAGSKQNAAAKKINPFNGNGDHTLYNSNRQISQKGYFKNYKLIEGLFYKYDENGLLKNIEKYKAGKYVGDAPIEEK